MNINCYANSAEHKAETEYNDHLDAVENNFLPLVAYAADRGQVPNEHVHSMHECRGPDTDTEREPSS